MLSDSFEKVFVINLARRPDRLNTFYERLPIDWPFRAPERFDAIDGSRTPFPRWWKEKQGAWGCYKTHLRLLEECLNRDIQSVLIMEDDAICCDGFLQKTRSFFENLPDDWNFVYLGGQHLQETVRLPREINEWVYRSFNVNRMHAYGLRGREIMESIYTYLHDYASWTVPHHVDHYLGELQKTLGTGLYVPRDWLVVQAEGESDITGRFEDQKRFPGAEELIHPEIGQTGIAILGDWFGGINLLAGVLHCLGINLGADMKFRHSPEHAVTFEDARLTEIFHHTYAPHWLTEKLPYEDRVNHLRYWAGIQCRAKPEEKYFCAKHPHLSLLGREMMEAWPEPLFLVVERPPDESLQTMSRSRDPWNLETFQRAVHILRQERETFLSKDRPRFLRISYNKLKAFPESEVRSICGFLELDPVSTQFERAVEMIWTSPDDDCVILP